MMVIISKIIFILCLLGILFIIGKKLPVLSQLPEKSLIGRFSFRPVFSWFKKVKEKFISSNFFRDLLVGLEKSLRKFKILVLKVDNLLEKFLKKLKKNSEENNMPS